MNSCGCLDFRSCGFVDMWDCEVVYVWCYVVVELCMCGCVKLLRYDVVKS